MIGFDQRVVTLATAALVEAGVSQAQAEQIATDNAQLCRDQAKLFRAAHQNKADIASGLDSSQYPAPPNPVYDVYAWQAAFIDLQAWVKANLVP